MQVLDGKNETRSFMPLTLTPFETEFRCEKHGAMRVTAMKGRYGDAVGLACPECERERETQEKAERERIAAERAEKARIERYKAMRIRPEYWDKTLDDYKPITAGQGEYLEAVKLLIETKRGKVIVLGGNGTGKTMLAAMALKALGGVTYTMFRMSLKMQSLGNEGMTREQFVDSLIDAPLLVVDEIGRSKGSEFEMNLLSDILDNRHTQDRPFIILSNTHFSRECPHGKDGCEKCFERYFDNDLLSRFRQDGKFIEFEKNAPDWRDPRNKKLWNQNSN